MLKIPRPIWPLSLFCVLLFWLTGCTFLGKPTLPTPVPTQTLSSQTPPSPDEFANRKNSFGDGYIAHISFKDVEGTSQEEIVRLLVTQWLEHYQAQSTAPDAAITDYTVDEITLTEGRSENDPSILAWVQFSILPAQTPNPWASFPGEAINPDDPWWHLEVLFGVYGDEPASEYYWLRMVPIG